MHILLARSFKQPFLDEMNALGYDVVFDTDSFDWNDVQVTIGWKKEWETPLFSTDSQLKWVHSISAGVDTLPLSEFASRDILVSNASGIHSESISDHVVGVLYMYTRQLFASTLQQKTHRWGLDNAVFKPLSELTVTIVGTGNIGTTLAHRLVALGVTVVGINRSGHAKEPFNETFSLDQLYEVGQKSDIVINILPLTRQTTRLYDKDFFATLQKHAAFINVGRGESVDEQALSDALSNEQFAFASIDVATTEPLPSDHFLWSTKHLMITPHISGYTPHFETKFMEIFLPNLYEFSSSGTLVRNQVDLEQGY